MPSSLTRPGPDQMAAQFGDQGPVLPAGPPTRSGIEKRHGVVRPSLSVEGRPDTEPLSVKKGNTRMPAKDATTESGGFSADERAAMKQRAAELRAEGKKGAKKADGLQAVLDSISEMAPEDRVLAERVHLTVTAAAPGLSPKTWYGMPAYANADGKVVVFLRLRRPCRGRLCHLPGLRPGRAPGLPPSHTGCRGRASRRADARRRSRGKTRTGRAATA